MLISYSFPKNRGFLKIIKKYYCNYFHKNIYVDFPSYNPYTFKHSILFYFGICSSSLEKICEIQKMFCLEEKIGHPYLVEKILKKNRRTHEGV